MSAHIAVFSDYFCSKGKVLKDSVSFTFNTVDKITPERKKLMSKNSGCL